MSDNGLLWRAIATAVCVAAIVLPLWGAGWVLAHVSDFVGRLA